MSCTFSIKQIISENLQSTSMLEQCEKNGVNNEFVNGNLANIIMVLPEIERFQKDENLELWELEVTSDVTGEVEIIIFNQKYDVLAFRCSCDELFSKEQIKEMFILDMIYIAKWQDLINNVTEIEDLIFEIELWSKISNYHPNTIPHLKAVIQARENLSPFGGNLVNEVELTIDGEEIFANSTDEDDGYPDYNLLHDDFDLSNPEKSIEEGVQNWDDDDDEGDDEIEEWDDEWESDYDEEEWDDEFEQETDDEWDS
ncbi:MAG: hypothetical protein OEY49_07970 [Candidatus Heimdallarchaeota archaeon]|nr:hypothetical protein [Candidatus Heimdallarchaeota archaeon]